MKELDQELLRRSVLNYRELGFDIAEAIAIDSAGINSRVMRVTSRKGEVSLLKFYRDKTQSDTRERRRNEYEFLKYVEKIKVDNTPKALATDEVTNSTLMEWIDGDQVQHQTKESVMAIGSFINRLSRREDKQRIAGLDEAADSLQSTEKLRREMCRRIEETRYTIDRREASDRERMYVEQVIYKTKKELKILRDRLEANHWQDFQDDQFASPSDLGIHNMMKAKGRYYFFDFEYAGRDDLSKAYTDLCLQPRAPLCLEDRELLAQTIKGGKDSQSNEVEGWEKRAMDIWEITRLKWCHIIIRRHHDTKRGGEGIAQLMQEYIEKTTQEKKGDKG